MPEYNPLLIGLYKRCKVLLAELARKGCKIRFHHVLRDFNKRADHLSNVAMSAVGPNPLPLTDAAVVLELIDHAVRDSSAAG